MVNQYYMYCVYRDFGPFFIKFSSYLPDNAKPRINGNEWVNARPPTRGSRSKRWITASLRARAPGVLETICDRLSACKIDALARKRLGFCRTRSLVATAGQGIAMTFDPAGRFSLTQVLYGPLTGRVFFEDVIRENLDLGRPDKVSLIFNRRINRRTQSRFRTRVITEGVTPSLHVDYKHSRIKQYHKQNQALRTDTTIMRLATSVSANASITSPRCYISAFKPTYVSLTSNELARTATSANKRSTKSASPSSLITSVQPRCASATLGSRRCSASWSSSPPAYRALQPRPANPPPTITGPPPQHHDRGQNDLRPPTTTPAPDHPTHPAH